MTTRLRRLSAYWQAALVCGLLLVFALELVHVARSDSATWDEAHHLYDGYQIWTRRDYRLNAEVPPLIKLAAAAPLLAMHLRTPAARVDYSNADAFRDGRAFVFGNGGDRVLFPARMACALITLLLACLLFLAAGKAFGRPAAFLSLALFIFDPNVLANGTLVTTDIGSACCFFGAVFAFYLYCRRPNAKRLLAAGLAAGLVMAAKYTGLLLVPMLVLLAAAEGLSARNLRLFGKRLAACAAILVCAWAVIWGFYGFRDKPAASGLELQPRLAQYITSVPNPKDAAKLALAARFHLLPEPYLWGLANTKKTEWEYTSYFFGRVYRHGPWQYFPAAFLIKSTLPLLILLCTLPFSKLGARAPEFTFFLVPVGVYFAVVTTSHFDIGSRHLLPVYPFLYVLAGASAAALFRRGPAWAGAAAILLAWQAVSSARTAPDYMAYGNEAWGGPSRVHRYLSDANVDWGQQLKAVRAYLEANHITNCWFAYFPDGAVEPADYGVHCRRLPTTDSLWWLKLPMEVPPVIDGTVLISDSDLAGIEFGDGSLNPYQAFQAIQPATAIMHGVYVYRGSFPVPLAAALVLVRKSEELRGSGQGEAALEKARQAAALAPSSALVQMGLAQALSGQAQWREAIEHFQFAAAAARAVRPDLQAESLLPQIAAGLAAAQARL